MYRKVLAASVLTAALVGLAACGGPATKTTASPQVAAPTSGCAVTKTEELYVTEMYTCADRSARVYLFNTSSARDSYRKAAEEFGSVVVGQGDTWLEVKAE